MNKEGNMKSRNLFLILFVLIFALTACGPKDTGELSPAQQTAIAGTVTAVFTDLQASQTAMLPEPTQTATPEPTLTPTATQPPASVIVGPNEYPEGVNPLTGLEVENPDLLKRRPVIMKVSNHQIDYQPHWGLSSADIVFEYFIGWGANRFAALYYGQDSDFIGPIRSIRRVDGQLGSLFEAVIGSTGGDMNDVLPYIGSYIPGRYFTDKYLCPGVCDDGRNMVYSVRANSAALSDYFIQNGYGNENPDLHGMAFSEEVPEGGQKGESAWVYYSYADYSRWVYNPETGKYTLWAYGEATGDQFKPLIDQNTGEALEFSNVILLQARYTQLKDALHNIDLIGNSDGQKATVFRDGMVYDVTWKTPQSTSPIQYFDSEGHTFYLKPGNTWVAIFGLTSPIEVENGDWSISFSMP